MATTRARLQPPRQQLQWLDELLGDEDGAARPSNQQRDDSDSDSDSDRSPIPALRRHSKALDVHAAPQVDGCSRKSSRALDEDDRQALSELEDEGDEHEPSQQTQSSPETDSAESSALAAAQRRSAQLQADVEVLATHLEAVTLERDRERRAARCELESARVEAEALAQQNAALRGERDELAREAAAAREAHEQLLDALAQHQQQSEALEAAQLSAGRERAQARQALDAAQRACRRLEEQLADAHAQVLALQGEREALQAALRVAARELRGEGDATQLRLQDEMIRSLRADLLQMEFDCQTLRADKLALAAQLARRDRRLGPHSDGSDGYDVVSLAPAPDASAKAHGQKKRTTVRPVRPKARDSVFGSLVDLPNTVNERDGSDGSPTAREGQYRQSHGRSHGPRLASLVAKTVRSASKRLGVASP